MFPLANGMLISFLHTWVLDKKTDSYVCLWVDVACAACMSIEMNLQSLPHDLKVREARQSNQFSMLICVCHDHRASATIVTLEFERPDITRL